MHAVIIHPPGRLEWTESLPAQSDYPHPVSRRKGQTRLRAYTAEMPGVVLAKDGSYTAYPPWIIKEPKQQRESLAAAQPNWALTPTLARLGFDTGLALGAVLIHRADGGRFTDKDLDLIEEAFWGQSE